MTPEYDSIDTENDKLCKEALELALKKSKKLGIHHYLLITECYKEVVRKKLEA
jgi:hypothetical protein